MLKKIKFLPVIFCIFECVCCMDPDKAKYMQQNLSIKEMEVFTRPQYLRSVAAVPVNPDAKVEEILNAFTHQLISLKKTSLHTYFSYFWQDPIRRMFVSNVSSDTVTDVQSLVFQMLNIASSKIDILSKEIPYFMSCCLDIKRSLSIGKEFTSFIKKCRDASYLTQDGDDNVYVDRTNNKIIKMFTLDGNTDVRAIVHFRGESSSMQNGEVASVILWSETLMKRLFLSVCENHKFEVKRCHERCEKTLTTEGDRKINIINIENTQESVASVELDGCVKCCAIKSKNIEILLPYKNHPAKTRYIPPQAKKSVAMRVRSELDGVLKDGVKLTVGDITNFNGIEYCSLQKLAIQNVKVYKNHSRSAYIRGNEGNFFIGVFKKSNSSEMASNFFGFAYDGNAISVGWHKENGLQVGIRMNSSYVFGGWSQSLEQSMEAELFSILGKSAIGKSSLNVKKPKEPIRVGRKKTNEQVEVKDDYDSEGKFISTSINVQFQAPIQSQFAGSIGSNQFFSRNIYGDMHVDFGIQTDASIKSPVDNEQTVSKKETYAIDNAKKYSDTTTRSASDKDSLQKQISVGQFQYNDLYLELRQFGLNVEAERFTQILQSMFSKTSPNVSLVGEAFSNGGLQPSFQCSYPPNLLFNNFPEHGQEAEVEAQSPRQIGSAQNSFVMFDFGTGTVDCKTLINLLDEEAMVNPHNVDDKDHFSKAEFELSAPQNSGFCLQSMGHDSSIAGQQEVLCKSLDGGGRIRGLLGEPKFHGDGEIQPKNGGTIRGIFEDGRLKFGPEDKITIKKDNEEVTLLGILGVKYFDCSKNYSHGILDKYRSNKDIDKMIDDFCGIPYNAICFDDIMFKKQIFYDGESSESVLLKSVFIYTNVSSKSFYGMQFIYPEDDGGRVQAVTSGWFIQNDDSNYVVQHYFGNEMYAEANISHVLLVEGYKEGRAKINFYNTGYYHDNFQVYNHEEGNEEKIKDIEAFSEQKEEETKKSLILYITDAENE